MEMDREKEDDRNDDAEAFLDEELPGDERHYNDQDNDSDIE